MVAVEKVAVGKITTTGKVQNFYVPRRAERVEPSKEIPPRNWQQIEVIASDRSYHHHLHQRLGASMPALRMRFSSIACAIATRFIAHLRCG